MEQPCTRPISALSPSWLHDHITLLEPTLP